MSVDRNLGLHRTKPSVVRGLLTETGVLAAVALQLERRDVCIASRTAEKRSLSHWL